MGSRRAVVLITWFVSLVGTGTSLYWSLVLGWIPCDLCWYERICMYPSFVILTIALLTRDSNVWRYVIALSGIGSIVALYHYLLQVVPALSNTISCSSPVPCQFPEFDVFGWITPPLFAFLAFAWMTLAAVLLLTKYRPRRHGQYRMS